MRIVDRGDGWVVVDTERIRTDGLPAVAYRPGPKRHRILKIGYHDPRSFDTRKRTDDAWNDLIMCDLFVKQMEAACSSTT